MFLKAFFFTFVLGSVYKGIFFTSVLGSVYKGIVLHLFWVVFIKAFFYICSGKCL